VLECQKSKALITYIPWYNLLAWVIEQEKNENVQNENENDTDVNYEIFIIEKNSSN
jgi:hypothetical protein